MARAAVKCPAPYCLAVIQDRENIFMNQRGKGPQLIQGKFFQGLAALLGIRDGPARNMVSVAKGDALGHEIIGQLCRVEEPFSQQGEHPLRQENHFLHHPGHQAQ